MSSKFCHDNSDSKTVKFLDYFFSADCFVFRTKLLRNELNKHKYFIWGETGTTLVFNQFQDRDTDCYFVK